MSYNRKITFTPIGYVKTDAIVKQIKDENAISTITLNPQLTMGLDGLAEFSHIFVLFYLNQVQETSLPLNLKVHPRGRTDLPLTGIFGTRTMLRPNPIGLTLVALLKVEGNVLTVRGLDAYDGTPVLDIKPYDPWDTAEDARTPEWWRKLYDMP
ncbi:MAG: tRNA (N6-threonylcarbamoyladenosine(37)-N6)-methyltransferase TrmO [Candidatus Bathyarchaeia archaeon]|jgi:tRNA-Thr(GGU) m(6)t(6)A37 methyltransferase TsaA